MYKSRRIAVVVPAYNEEHFIGQVIDNMPVFVDEVIVVDDCSQDGTFQTARSKSNARVLVVKTPSNQGVGGATVTGYRHALEKDSHIVVKMDGDDQMDPNYLPQLMDAIVEQGYDYAKGNRFLVGGSLAIMPKHRLFGNVVLTFMTKLASGYWHIFDPQNGYTAVRADALRLLSLDRIHKGYFFENDMLFHLNLHSLRVKDVAIPPRYGKEESNVNLLKVGITFPLLLTRRFFSRIYQRFVLRDFSPIALFLFLGLALFLWGAILGAYLWIHTLLTGLLTPTGTIMLAILPLILGFQLLLQAVVLDIQETPK